MTTLSVNDPDTSPTADRSKLGRYVLVTALAAPANLLLYLVFFVLLAWPALAANLAAATFITVPTYLANRQWVWRLTVDRSIIRQALPYWLSTIISVLASSSALWFLTRLDASNDVLAIAPLVVYTALWLARYAFLDRVLFDR